MCGGGGGAAASAGLRSCRAAGGFQGTQAQSFPRDLVGCAALAGDIGDEPVRRRVSVDGFAIDHVGVIGLVPPAL